MCIDRAVHACAEQGRSTVQMANAPNMERDPVHSGVGLPMGDAVKRLAALHNGPALFLPFT